MKYKNFIFAFWTLSLVDLFASNSIEAKETSHCSSNKMHECIYFSQDWKWESKNPISDDHCSPRIRENEKLDILISGFDKNILGSTIENKETWILAGDKYCKSEYCRFYYIKDNTECTVLGEFSRKIEFIHYSNGSIVSDNVSVRSIVNEKFKNSINYLTKNSFLLIFHGKKKNMLFDFEVKTPLYRKISAKLEQWGVDNFGPNAQLIDKYSEDN